MTARENILGRIRTELAKAEPPERPPLGEVWPRTNPSREELLERFASELDAVGGELIRCRSAQEARSRLAELIDQGRWQTIGAVDCQECREVVAGRMAERIAWTRDGWDPKEIAELSAGLVAADVLLADTGSCLVTGATPEQRLMCYLPPVSVVVARVEQLHEHLPAAWEEIARWTAEPERRGEFVIITGPSRTADIEKILILGVHGPKRLVVLLVD